MTTPSYPRDGIFGRYFWRQALERALKSAAQAVIGVWMIADGVLNWWDVDVSRGIGVAVGAAILSLLTSVVSAPVGPVDTPSVV